MVLEKCLSLHSRVRIVINWSMSRSVKKHPFVKICGTSDKQDKIYAHRRFRYKSKKALLDMDYEHLPRQLKDVSDVWSFKSDGLAYFLPAPTENEVRPWWSLESWKRLMRK